jgi:hypothetical protein
MKSFIIKLLIFCLPVLIILLPLDVFLSENLKKSETFVLGEFQVWNDIYNRKINADVVIYGASRALYINPGIIEDSLNRSCYNLGINGLGFWHIYLRHRELLRYNRMPKYIIISIDDFSLVKDVNLFQKDQFLPYMLGNNNFRKYLKDVNSFSFFDYYIPLIRYYGRRNAIQKAIECSFAKENSIPLRKKGYMAWDLNWNNDFGKAQTELGYIEVKNDSTSISLFNDFLNECSLNKIKVIFINTPEYIDGQLFIKNRDEVINIYKNFSNKYDIVFFDYSNDEMCYHREYFFNAQHLNKTGAELFNRKLVRDLKNTNNRTGIYLSPE